jgi:hypothetical protein
MATQFTGPKTTIDTVASSKKTAYLIILGSILK